MESLKLLLSILIHSHVQMTCGAEGNSGEFSSEAEAERLDNVLGEVKEMLNKQFKVVTGYLPVFENNLDESIVFFQKALERTEDLSYICDYDRLEIKMYSSCTFSETQGFGYYFIGTWKLVK